MWEVRKIEEEDKYWEIDIDLYGGKDLEELQGELIATTFKKPEDFSDDLFDEETSTIAFMAVDTEKYIKEFGGYVPAAYAQVCYVEGLKIKFDFTIEGGYDVIEKTYNDKGILIEYVIYFENVLVLKKELTDYSKKEPVVDVMLWVFVGCAIAISALVSINVIRKKRKEKAEQRTWINFDENPKYHEKSLKRTSKILKQIR